MIKIRKSILKDIPYIQQLASVTKQLQDSPDTPPHLSQRELEAYITSNHDIMLTATNNQNIIGFVMAHGRQDSGLAYLENIMVSEQYRAQGVGEMLFTKLDEELKRLDFVDIWCLTQDTNTFMQEILQKKGWVKGNKFFIFSKELK